MIGSGTQDDPWVPLTAEELNDAWSNKGGFIDFTCDIDLLDMKLGPTCKTQKPIVNLNGFSLIVNSLTAPYGTVFNYSSGAREISNGIIIINKTVPLMNMVSVTFGNPNNSVSNILVVNKSDNICRVAVNAGAALINNACINLYGKYDSLNRFDLVYQNEVSSIKGVYVIGEASHEHIISHGLDKNIWYVKEWLGGKNLCIEQKGHSFVAGVTRFNGLNISTNVTVIGHLCGERWDCVSDSDGKFKINLGTYNFPVSVFSIDYVNRNLREYNHYDVGDVAITHPDNGVKFTCIKSGVTDALPTDFPSTGEVVLGGAIFTVSNIIPSSCAGPMIPSKKYSNYVNKPK